VSLQNADGQAPELVGLASRCPKDVAESVGARSRAGSSSPSQTRLEGVRTRQRHCVWIRAAERRNRVHPYHRAEDFDDLRHFVFTFHDSIFEALAREFDVHLTDGSTASVLQTMAARLAHDA
jgi:hypothetical protein